MATWLEDFLSNNRELVIASFAVPASFLYQSWQDLENWIYRTTRNTNREHDAEVARIQARVREGYRLGKRMCTARQPWKTMSIRSVTYKDDAFQVPIDLRNVLEIDVERRIVRAEPCVTMGDITHHLVPRGYALAVQAEMDDLTLGGLCMGVGIETSSHREGFLFETVEAFEIVTSEGELVRATREQNADLFHALPWSHGTLGFLVAVELRIVPIESHVEVTYHPAHTMDEFCRLLRGFAESPTPPTYVEGIVFSRERGVVITGEPATPRGDAPINRINNYYKPWFYTRVEETLRLGWQREYIPIRHYFHRHTPSVFFQLKDLITFANTPAYRWLWAWLGAPKVSLMKLSMTRELRRQTFYNRVAQDILVPIEDLGRSVRKSDELFGIYPLWVCPVRLFDHRPHRGMLRNPTGGRASQMYVDLGIYGIPPSALAGSYDAISASRALEAFVRDRGGYQMLYADHCMTRAELERMFDHRHYRRMRRKYRAERAFPEVYDKVLPEEWLFGEEGRARLAALRARDAASSEVLPEVAMGPGPRQAPAASRRRRRRSGS